MFKKTVKRSKNFSILDNSEVQVEIKATQTKKKVSKWLDVPAKTSQLTSEDFSIILNSPEKPIEVEKEDLLEDISHLYTIDTKPEEIREVFDSLDERPHVQAFDEGEDSSLSEEMEKEEILIESDPETWDFPGKPKFGENVRVADLICFLKDKTRNLEEMKSRYLVRLQDVRDKKSEVHENLGLLLLEHHKKQRF